MSRLPHGAVKVLRRDPPLRGFAGTVLGRIHDGVLVRAVTERRHLLLSLDAWPLGAQGVERARRAGVRSLRYVEAGVGSYSVTLEAFIAQAVRRTFPGHPETQFLLPRNQWTFCPSMPRPSVSQTDLFEASAAR